MDTFIVGKIIASVPFLLLACGGLGILYSARDTPLGLTKRRKRGLLLLVVGAAGLLAVYGVNASGGTGTA